MKPIFWPMLEPTKGRRQAGWDDARLRRSILESREQRYWHKDTSVMVWWEPRGEVAQLQGCEAAAEFWACILCGRVTRHACNSQAPAEPVIYHYTTCPNARWRTCKPSSEALGYPVEFADGVDARRWRCATCRVQYSDAQARRFIDDPAARLDFFMHRRTCAYFSSARGRPATAISQIMRNREVLGQEALFASVDLEVGGAT